MKQRSTIGHNAQFAAIASGLKSGRLHHAYILAGPRGVGKATFAKDIAGQIVDPDGHQQSLLDAGNHPDILTLERPPKEAPAEGERVAADAERKRSIPVELIREMKPRIMSRPTISDRRVVIIDAADDLERSSANALLKILEEPPAGTVFLLISHASERLLQTIRSRCQLLRFQGLSDGDVNNVVGLELPELKEADRQLLVKLAGGSPGQAIEFAAMDMATIEKAMIELAEGGHENNRSRVELIRQLSLKNAQQRYEAFLDRAPHFIADRVRNLPIGALANGADIYNRACELSGRATGLSLDKKAVVFEMANLLARIKSLNAAK